jgi:hypothetical protein
MADSYRINGPTTIGDATLLNQILGDVSLANITSTEGDMVYSDAVNNLVRLAAPANTSVMLFNNSGDATPDVPVWLAAGNVGEVLTVTAANVIGWQTTNSEASVYGFSAHLSSIWFNNTDVATPVNVNTWSVANTAAGEFDTTSGAFDTANGIFTVSGNGYYLINSGIQFTNSSNAGNRNVRIIRNNTNALIQQQWQPTGNTAAPQVINVGGTFRLATSDQISLQLWPSQNASAINLIASPGESNGTYLSIERLATI